MPVISEPTPLGTPAPAFALPDLHGNLHTMGEYLGKSKATVVVFVCNHCPYVVHVEQELGRVAGLYSQRGVAFVAICPNDVVNYPEDSVTRLREQAIRAGWGFDYLIDETQNIARAYGALCTPDFFIFDAAGLLAYRGSMDESSPGNGKAHDGSALRGALDLILAGDEVPLPHIPSMGCGIKWKP